MTRVAVAVGAALLAVPVLLAVLAGGILTALLGAPSPASPTPSPAALADIPPDYLVLYQQAAADCPGLDWTLLAAIGKVESDHGRDTAPGVSHGENPAGAAGPMQILQPTFAAILARHPLPPGGAEPPSRYDPHDAVHAAAGDLCDHGVTTDPGAAVSAFNHSGTYVAAVLAQAARYRQAGPSPTRPDGWAPEPATIPDPSGTGGHVTPRTATLYHALAATGALREGATCWDPHLQNPDSDHPRGRACDLFFHPHDPADVTRGWALAHWLTTQDAVYGVHYIIWQGLIWTAESPTWTTYHSTVYGCPNPANLTGCHYDHIHVSLL